MTAKEARRIAQRFSVSTLLGCNTKLQKTDKSGEYLSGGVSLAPHTLSGVRNTCKHSTIGCRESCLGRFSGLNVDPRNLQAKVNKTLFLTFEPEAYYALLSHEIGLLTARAEKKGALPVVRLNVYTDIPFERERPTLFASHPDVQFMDYTKDPDRFGSLPANYHLTFSLSEKNSPAAKRILESGNNVAAVFHGSLPEEFLGYPVISGDESDARFADPSPVVVGLSLKGTKEAKRVAIEQGFARVT